MLMYIVNVLLLFFYAIVLLWLRPTPAKKKAFCFMAAGNWICLSGLRHYSIGADTYAYRRIFYNSRYISWEELFENFKNTFFSWDIFGSDTIGEGGYSLIDVFTGENVLAVKDPGYAIFNKAFYTICPNYTVFLIFIALVFMIPFAILIYRYSSEPLLSFLIYSSLFFSFFAITGHRQTLATGVALISYLAFAERKKFIPFLLTILLAIPLHKSVLGFIPIYFLQFVKMDRKKAIAVLLMFPLVFFLRRPIVTVLAFLSGYTGYISQTEGGAYTFLLVYVALMIVTLWKGKSVIELNPHANWALAAVSVAFLLTPLVFANANMMRVVQYYSIFLVLYVPDLIISFKGEECRLVYFGATALLLFLLFRGNPQYMFFWQ